jgi:hypothetical protein
LNIPAQIDSDGKTVWVNSHEGCCIGRFSRDGIDVHHDAPTQIERGQQCLDCKKGPTTLEDWVHFVEAMKRHFDVVVPGHHMPRFLAVKQYVL